MATTAAQAQGGLSLSLPQASHLLTSFTDFLTVAVHNVLYYRSLYPPATFLTARAYNLAVHQSRHPGVCTWVGDAVAAIRAQLIQGAVERVALAIHAPGTQVLERWMFDLRAFPAFTDVKDQHPPPSANGSSSRRDEEDDGVGPGGPGSIQAAEAMGSSDKINWTDVDEGLRAAVRKMASAAEQLPPLPEGCTYTVAVELRDESKAPIGYPQHWIPSQTNLQTKSKSRPEPGRDIGGSKTVAIRTVEAGPLYFDCWVELGKVLVSSSSFASSG
ncbi:mitotic spindle assembly checkpoint protein MAD2 [Apiospora kogelbergensis]|uniref:Mitotic spindle assembly checkpoint protein MAD2 n=1 Tax=Apiospora kogelbergensis TaxID=1337665 RepID=A0AAW0QKK0_9PEZI